jgi:hypothetical protein
VYAYALAAAAVAGDQCHLAASYAKQLREITYQVFIGPAVNGYRGDLDLQAVCVDACQRVVGRAGLQMDGEDQIITIPMIPGMRHRSSEEQGHEQHPQHLQGDERKQGREVNAGYRGDDMPDWPQQGIR